MVTRTSAVWQCRHRWRVTTRADWIRDISRDQEWRVDESRKQGRDGFPPSPARPAPPCQSRCRPTPRERLPVLPLRAPNYPGLCGRRPHSDHSSDDAESSTREVQSCAVRTTPGRRDTSSTARQRYKPMLSQADRTTGTTNNCATSIISVAATARGFQMWTCVRETGVLRVVSKV
jgi:hypothetical protein